MLFYMHQQHIIWYLITVATMGKLNPFFSELAQQIHKMYEQVALITQIWHSTRGYFTSMSNTWCLITVPSMNKITIFLSDISQLTLTIYENYCHNYSNVIQSQILLDNQQTIAHDHGTQYEENPATHHGGMCKYRRLYGWSEHFPIFPDSA